VEVQLQPLVSSVPFVLPGSYLIVGWFGPRANLGTLQSEERERNGEKKK
jgi:hypothetical protein